MGTHLFDTHSKPVHESVWKLFDKVINRFRSAAIMVEWDGDIPEFPVYEGELFKAYDIWLKNFEKVKDGLRPF